MRILMASAHQVGAEAGRTAEAQVTDRAARFDFADYLTAGRSSQPRRFHLVVHATARNRSLVLIEGKDSSAWEGRARARPGAVRCSGMLGSRHGSAAIQSIPMREQSASRNSTV